ncbi:hypothetical protein F5Y19DRAFT_490219 [Xylariaceae sp. FL1651]|nr:hypothetical protein F5Y19DRAFT_490219 [Xylariaceae sp. FL1651]
MSASNLPTRLQPFAIVGMAFKMPQEAVDESSLWSVLENRKNLMTHWPESRITLDAFYDKDSETKPNMLSGPGGHFIKEDPGAFDASFFSIPPREAEAMDPQQRWALEAVYHALENAGIPVKDIHGSRTAVFSASFSDDYQGMVSKDPDAAPRQTVTGTATSILANRISWYFNLRGPSVHVDTACSSGLVALDMACQAMRSGDATAALVFGTNVLLDPGLTIFMSNINALSPDSRCYSFDSRANGYARGEGVVVIFIKPLSDAIQNGDVIRAIIRATASNQDGRTPGITQPSSEAQESLIRHVYRRAGLGFDETRYFEAHGTGTPVGDPVEMKAIGRVFRKFRSSQQPLYVGSVKANIGHLEPASGLAAIVKSVLVLEKGVIPPNALFENLNPDIDANFFNIEVPTKCIPWPTSGLRRVSVNSFGFGGTNSHVILDDALSYLQSHNLPGYHHTEVISAESQNECPSFNNCEISGLSQCSKLLVFSAADKAALQRLVDHHQTYYRERISNRNDKLDQLAYTLAARRTLFSWRTYAILATSRSVTANGEQQVGDETTSLVTSTPIQASTEQTGSAFIFTGQGAQYPRMGLELLQYPAFKESIIRSNHALTRIGCEWSVINSLERGETIDSPEFSQPLCTILQIALVDLLRTLNVAPVAVVGHSSGEIAAAYAAGALSQESACQVAYYRGEVVEKLRAASMINPGAMMSVNIAELQVAGVLERSGLEKGALHVACVNSPTNLTLAGRLDDINILKKYLDQQGIFAQKINTMVAYHSPAMQQISADYLHLLESLGILSGKTQPIPMVSSVTCKVAAPDLLATAQYWVDNLISPVRFATAVQRLSDNAESLRLPLGSSAITDLIEVGPHAALRRPLKDTLPSMRYHSVLERGKSPLTSILELLGMLFCHGYSVSILGGNHYSRGTLPPLVDCPSYPFNHNSTYWDESRLSKDWRLRQHSHGYLLGRRAHDWNPLQPRWRNWVCKEIAPWLGDHVISDTTICPGSGILAMAIEAATQFKKSKSRQIPFLVLKNVQFIAPIIVGDTLQDATETVVELRPVQTAIERETSKSEIRIFSYRDSNWTECFYARVETQYHEIAASDLNVADEAYWEDRQIRENVKCAMESCTVPVEARCFYEFCEEHGFRYGPSFQKLRDIFWDGNSASCAHIDISAALEDLHRTADSPVHPAILDSILHSSIALFSKGLAEGVGTFVPRRISNMRIAIAPWDQMTSKVRLSTHRHKEDDRSLDIYALADDDSILCAINGLAIAEVSGISMVQGGPGDGSLLHSIAWKPQLSSLSKAELQMLCAFDGPIANESVLRKYCVKMERAARAAACQVTKLFSGDDLGGVPGHIKKLLACLEYRYVQVDDRVEWPNDLELQTVLDECEAEMPELRLLPQVARALPSIIRGETDPLELLFNTKSAESFYTYIFQRHIDAGQLSTYLDLLSHESPSLRILEVGAGTGSVTRLVLNSFAAFEQATGQSRFLEYVYTDISPAFFEGARTEFRNFEDRMVYKVLDLQVEPISQGFDLATYDLIVAGSVLHICADLTAALDKVRRLLTPSGQLVIFENTKPNTACIDVAFGVLEGWWFASEEWRQHGPLINEQQWDALLRKTGFTGINATFRDAESDEASFTSIMISAVPDASCEDANNGQDEIIFLINPLSSSQWSLSRDISKHYPCTRIIELDPEINNAHAISASSVVISLLEVNEKFLSTLDAEGFDMLRDYVSAAHNLFWVTSCPRQDDSITDPHLALSTGFFRAIRSEQTYKHIVTLAVEPCAYGNEAKFVLRVLRSCFRETSPCAEIEFVVRDGLLTIGRLVCELELDTERICRLQPRAVYEPWRPDPPLALEVATPGMLDTLRFIEDQKDAINADELEIEAVVWPISFRDVLIAIGNLDDKDFGFECAGIVSKVGQTSAVQFQPGDRVLVVLPGCMRSHPRAPPENVFKVPDSLSLHDAVASLNPGMTAYHALVNVARIQQGERILIHSAAGSTGQMAVKIAKMLGAEVFATVGSEEKRKLAIDPNGLGIAESHVFSSRSISFAKGVKRVTGGYGVDVVLNSLSGDYLQASWDCIAPYGRFVEIGKADINANSSLPMGSFAKNASFAAIDLHHIVQTNSKLTRLLVENVLDLLVNQEISCPAPLHFYPVSDLEKAFRYMQSGKNTGRILVTLGNEDMVSKHILLKSSWQFETNATYVVAGGLGGLGRTIIWWMAERGAKNLILPSRSGISSPAAARIVAELSAKGVRVMTPCCDVSSAPELEKLLKDHADMPPIKGCINATMVLQDAIFENMTFAQWSCTIKSKVDSSWNLHSLLPRNLDFFILLSSLAGIYGSTSQCNYAAGNTFQDALAQARTTSGIGRSSIALDLGWMQDIGIIAERSEYRRHRDKVGDMGAVYATDLLALLDHYCDPALPQLTGAQKSQLLVGVLTPQHYYSRGQKPLNWIMRPMYAGFDVVRPDVSASAKRGDGIQEDFAALFRKACEPNERCDIMERALVNKMARTLGVEVKDIDHRKMPSDYGVDSLMAVELRNWLQHDFRATITVFEIMSGATIEAIGQLVTKRAAEKADK